MSLVPNRECGTCTVCCKEFAIDSPQLKKPPGIRCQYCVPGSGCTIHDALPDTCRDFFCGWRRMGELDDAWRPDRSGIAIVYIDTDIPPAFQAMGNGIKFDILKPKALGWDPLLVTIGQCLQSGIATFLGVPGPPGHLGHKFLLNGTMADAVRSRDRRRLVADLTAIYQAGVNAPRQRAT